MHSQIRRLQRVMVQFGKAKKYGGLVVDVHENPPVGYNAKFIEAIIDQTPLFNSKQIKLWNWISNYYMCSLGDVYTAATPGALKINTDSVIVSKIKDLSILDDFRDVEKEALNFIALKRLCSFSDLLSTFPLKNAYRLLKNWIADDLIEVEDSWSHSYKPKMEKAMVMSSEFLFEESFKDLLEDLSRSPKQQNLVLAYKSLHKANEEFKEISKKRLLKKANTTSSVAKALIDKSIFFETEIVVDRVNLSSAEGPDKALSLSEDQLQAKSSIQAEFEKKQVCLFRGVTGSGKTEIYISLIKEQLAKGENVLLLVPEITLSTQLISRLEKFFKNQLLAYHSKINANKRVEVWENILSSDKPRLIVGVRSSIFLPFKKLGLIIVDEEHEPSYKQYEPAPRYHARDVAIVLGHFHEAKVLLGSATPCVESHYNALVLDKYGYVELNKRFGKARLPEIWTINMSKEGSVRKGEGFISMKLHDAIEDRLRKEEQSILFQNRRGYVPQVLCQTCGYIPMCVNCDVPLTYHKYLNQLKCHYCGHKEAVFGTCPSCNSNDVQYKGLGTERIQEDLKLLFPDVRIDRLDLESAGGKKNLDDIIASFETGKSQVLVGTQMLSKGLDFAGVTLVGVVSIEHLLAFPDFRSNERTFQLISQVAGRAGRGDKPGEVFIQTYNPDNTIVQQILKQDLEGFYQQELAERQVYQYPPYFRLIKFSLRYKDKELLWQIARNLHQHLTPIFGKYLQGPEAPYVERVRAKYIVEMQGKFPANANSQKVKDLVLEALDKFRTNTINKRAYLVIDVDPN